MICAYTFGVRVWQCCRRWCYHRNKGNGNGTM